jgi:phosphoglycolate phosphatase-like HAD superfamily hydrolase
VLFDGVAGMLAALDDAGTVWGIVTNKPEYLAPDPAAARLAAALCGAGRR